MSVRNIFKYFRKRENNVDITTTGIPDRVFEIIKLKKNEFKSIFNRAGKHDF